MPDDARTVPVTFQLDAASASALDDPAMRDQVEDAIRRTIRNARVDRLFELIGDIKAEAHRRGLTDEIVDAELEAYNAERRERPPAT